MKSTKSPNQQHRQSSNQPLRALPTRSGDRLDTALERASKQEIALEPSRFWTRAVTWGLIATAVFGGTFLGLAKTEEIVVASGKLEPMETARDVKIPIGGVTSEVLVKEGQQVKAGDVLLKIDAEASAERKKNLEQAIRNKQSQLQLKQAELTQFLQLNDSQQRTLSSNLELQREILKRYRMLEQEGASAELQYLQQRDRVVQTEGQLQQTRDDRLRQLAILNQQQQLLNSELVELRSQLSEQAMMVRYKDVVAPVSGYVFDLKVYPGSAVQAAEAVMQVVPEDALHAVVEIPSQSIGFVSVGQPTEISIDSYPANEFGVVKGTVERIGSDALPPNQAELRTEFRFPADISLATQHLEIRDGRKLPLQAGMSLTANIRLREVSYLQLLLGSFRQKADSLRQI